MDGPRFDAWTRALAGGLPRRRAIKVLAGAGVAGVAIRSSIHQLGANVTCPDCGGDCTARGNTCVSPDECCGTDICIFADCVACLGKGDNNCRLGAHDCCPGLSCRDDGPGVSCQDDKNPGKKHDKHGHHKKNKH